MRLHTGIVQTGGLSINIS